MSAVSRPGGGKGPYTRTAKAKPGPVTGAFEGLEPDEAKVSCPVLRGQGRSNAALLPDYYVARKMTTRSRPN